MCEDGGCIDDYWYSEQNKPYFTISEVGFTGKWDTAAPMIPLRIGKPKGVE
jgi:hypothetical protein